MNTGGPRTSARALAALARIGPRPIVGPRAIAVATVGALAITSATIVAILSAAGAQAQRPAPGSGTVARGPNGGAGAPSISASGARIAFASDATNLVRRDSNGATVDPFVRDLALGYTIVADRTRSRRQALRGGRLRRGPGFALSADGRYVVFSSSSSDLGAASGDTQVWRRDLVSGATTLVSTAPGGSDGDSENPAISADGRFVVFESRATNLTTAGDDNAHTDVYWRDVARRLTRRVSQPPPELDLPGTAGSSLEPSVSADGRFVAFTSDGGGLVRGAPSSASIYRRDMVGGMTEAVDIAPELALAPAAPSALPAQGGGEHPAISADGRHVLFDSDATDLPGGGDNGALTDVYIRDMQTAAVSLVSRGPDGSVANGDASAGSLTPDGRFVAYSSAASNLSPGDLNGTSDVFVRDLATGSVTRASSGPDGLPGDGPSIAPALSADGRYVAFLTRAPRLSGQPAGPDRVIRKDRTTGAIAVATIGIDLRPLSLIGAPARGAVPRRRLRSFEGTARDDFLVARVEIAVSRRSGRSCLWLAARGTRAARSRFVKRPCRRPLFVPTRLRSHLRFTHPFRGLLARGTYTVRSRAIDDRGQVERTVSVGRNLVRFTLR